MVDSLHASFVKEKGPSGSWAALQNDNASRSQIWLDELEEMYTGSEHEGTLTQITKGAHMSELDKLLNGHECPKVMEAIIPKQTEKPTAAANKAHCLSDQEKAIAAAGVGGCVFRSAATFLAAIPEIKGYKK